MIVRWERFTANYLSVCVCGGLLRLIYFHYCHYHFCVRDNYRDWQIANAILLGKFVTFCRIIYTPLHECLFLYLFIYFDVFCVSVSAFSFSSNPLFALCYVLPWRWNLLATAFFIIHTSHDRHTYTHPSTQCIVNDKSHLQEWHLETCVPYGLPSHSILVVSSFSASI